MNPGEMRERVTVQIASQSTNSFGEAVLSWSNSTSVWANVQGVTARESLGLGQQEIAITHRVKMRYLPGLTQNMRFAWRGRTLDIVSLLEQQNRSVHEVICQETV